MKKEKQKQTKSLQKLKAPKSKKKKKQKEDVQPEPLRKVKSQTKQLKKQEEQLVELCERLFFYPQPVSRPDAFKVGTEVVVKTNEGELTATVVASRESKNLESEEQKHPPSDEDEKKPDEDEKQSSEDDEQSYEDINNEGLFYKDWESEPPKDEADLAKKKEEEKDGEHIVFEN